jgi:predicted lactoylglutathione lyase
VSEIIPAGNRILEVAPGLSYLAIEHPGLGSAAEGTQLPLHMAFAADNRSQVDEFYRQALAAGGKDNGPPGIRPHYHANYYAAFVIGPDGHNVEAVCHRPPEAI